MSKVSILIPSRNERFLQKTIDDVFAKAEGEIEVIAHLDGYWPDPPLKDYPTLLQIHRTECVGMRAGINAMANIASGDYLMKLDGHCLVAPGFDEELKKECEDDWIVVPRRHRLEPEAWIIKDDGRQPIDAHFLSYPFARPADKDCGLHGTVWNERAKSRTDVLIDDEMSSQGSCYFLKKKYWERIGPLDDINYGTFAQEMQEVGNKCWLGGGRLVVNKKTYYAHLHKGKTYGTGYGFSNTQWTEWAAQNKRAHDFTIDYWMNNRWPDRVHDFSWLIDKFSPVPGWPDNWKDLPTTIEYQQTQGA